MVAGPATTPVTTPPETDAVPGALLLQVPPPVASDNVIVEPAQTLVGPLIAPTTGGVPTDTVCVAVAVPQLLVTW